MEAGWKVAPGTHTKPLPRLPWREGLARAATSARDSGMRLHFPSDAGLLPSRAHPVMSVSSTPVTTSRSSAASTSCEPEAGFDFARRRESLIRRLGSLANDADAALVSDPHDIAYLTGVREGISWLAVWDGGCFAVTRHMLIREVTTVAADCELILPGKRSSDRADLERTVVSELKRRKFATVALDLARLNAASYLHLAHCASAEGMRLVATSSLVGGLRQRKDERERQLISRCIEISESALGSIIAGGAAGLIGRSELQIARELEAPMIELGAGRQGFPGDGIIVASGPNSASAHHRPGDRLVSPGEPLLIDWGAELDGYRSDMTRTFFIGHIPEFARKAYPVVEAALEAARQSLKVGETMGAVDHAARQTVMDAGYCEFHYGIGHGVGLAIHEGPWLRAHSEEILETDMVTTIEPGIYLPEVGGIRIECMFSLAASGARRMDRLSTSLDAMVLS